MGLSWKTTLCSSAHDIIVHKACCLELLQPHRSRHAVMNSTGMHLSLWSCERLCALPERLQRLSERRPSGAAIRRHHVLFRE